MWRLGISVALSFAVIVLALSALAAFIVLRSQQADAAGLLRQAASLADDVTDPPAGVYLAIQGPEGHEITPGAPAGLPDQAAFDRTSSTGVAETDLVSLGGTSYQVYTLRRTTDTTQAILNLGADHRERDRLWMAMLASGGLGLLCSAAVGMWVGRRAVRPMAAALALQRRFVSDASHELRTPLALLTIRAQLHQRHLRAGADNQVLTDEADGVVTDASHLTEIVEDLLLAADTRSGDLSVTVDLVTLAAEVVAATNSVAEELSITITLRHQQPAVLVRGTPGGLRRALTSLLDNAVRHARSAITITVDRAGSRAVVEVTDDGPGIDPAVRPRMFDRFSSTAGSEAVPTGRFDRRRYGLGLALVSEITARHGGSISAHDAPQGGATLRLALPALNGTDDRSERTGTDDHPERTESSDRSTPKGTAERRGPDR
jgi:signal transduction histidine kinase